MTPEERRALTMRPVSPHVTPRESTCIETAPGCPHSSIGDPLMCSLCLKAKPNIVTRDATTGGLLENGIPVTSRAFVAKTPTPRNVKKPAGVVQVRRRPDPADIDE